MTKFQEHGADNNIFLNSLNEDELSLFLREFNTDDDMNKII